MAHFMHEEISLGSLIRWKTRYRNAQARGEDSIFLNAFVTAIREGYSVDEASLEAAESGSSGYETDAQF
jgi:hypothetical protein